MFYYLLFTNITDDFYSDLKETINNYYGKVVDSYFSFEYSYLILKEELLSNNLDEYLTNIITDNLLRTKVFKSNLYNNTNEIINEIKDKTSIFKNVSNNYKQIYYEEKELYKLYFKSKVDNNIKKHILKKYYQDEEMLKTLKVFFENDLNILETSKKLNVHRNTLNYRLSKFYEETNLDAKCLEDAFIIVQLL